MNLVTLLVAVSRLRNFQIRDNDRIVAIPSANLCEFAMLGYVGEVERCLGILYLYLSAHSSKGNKNAY